MVNVTLEVRMIAHSLDEVTLDRVYWRWNYYRVQPNGQT